MIAFLVFWNIVTTVIAVRAICETRYIHQNISTIYTILWEKGKEDG